MLDQPSGFTTKARRSLTQAVWAFFFILFGFWLAARSLVNGSLLLTAIDLCAFILLLTAVRYCASRCLNHLVSASAVVFKHHGIENGDASAREALADPGFPNEKMRFLLFLCVAVVLIQLMSEVTRAWASALLGVLAMLVLHFAQTKPDFQPFRWWALMILPLAPLSSAVLGVPLRNRAPIASISFGVALLWSAVLLLRRANSARVSGLS